MDIFCTCCNKNVEAVKKTGKEIYPHIKSLYSRTFYSCPFCQNYVGTHPNTDIPLGCIPHEELKKARIKAHNIMDYYWKSGLCSRKKIYQIISKELGYTYHNGNTKTVAECEKAIDIIKKHFNKKE